MYAKFPAVGHRYFVDFQAFQVELDFTSEASLTYYNLDKVGKKVGSETVTIRSRRLPKVFSWSPGKNPTRRRSFISRTTIE